MNNKAKKFLALAAPAILTLPILFGASLAGCSKKPEESKKDKPEHTHTFVCTDESATQHKKTCSGCTEVNELVDHVYDDDYDETCNDCTHTRIAPKYSAASRVILSTDKKEISAGDTFTLTVEITSKREDLTWFAISLDIGALVSASSDSQSKFAYSHDLNSMFEYDEEKGLTTNLDYFKARWFNLACDRFNHEEIRAFRLGLAANTTVKEKSSKTVTISATLKVKEDASYTGPITFGVIDDPINSVSFRNDSYAKVFDNADNTSRVDRGIADIGEVGLDINKLTLNIVPKKN